MNLLRLFLNLDHDPSGQALAESFGDSFLFCRNPIYRTIRQKLLESQIRFLASGPEADLYRSAPLLALPRILNEKVLPFHGNRAVLEALAASALPIELEELPSLVTLNTVLHESAHLVVDLLLKSHDLPRAEGILLSEALANALELYVVAASQSEAERYFLRFQTAYTLTAEQRRHFSQRNSFLSTTRAFYSRLIGLEADLSEHPILQTTLAHFNPEFVKKTGRFYFKSILGVPFPETSSLALEWNPLILGIQENLGL